MPKSHMLENYNAEPINSRSSFNTIQTVSHVGKTGSSVDMEVKGPRRSLETIILKKYCNNN